MGDNKFNLTAFTGFDTISIIFRGNCKISQMPKETNKINLGKGSHENYTSKWLSGLSS